MDSSTAKPRIVLVVLTLVAAAAGLTSPALSADFQDDVARVDRALKTNPSRVLGAALESCLKQRRFAVELYYMGQEARAERSLRYCYRVLKIPEEAPPPKVAAVKKQDLKAKAQREIDLALAKTPDVANGLKLYRECAACHMPEGWGLSNGTVPQIAGQHRNVVVKQMADIRAGNRHTVLMAPYASEKSIGDAQAVADVSAYVDTLEISVETGKGPGDELELGERLYREKCAACHGPTGAGSNETFTPRIHAQHYNYLVRQFEWIRDGLRPNANPEMVAHIQEFKERETHAVLDYVSRLAPPEIMQAPPGWKNPDFE